MITFFVPGIPVAKGSAKAFYSPKAKRIMVMQDNRDRQKPWASLISYTAQEQGCKPVAGPVALTLKFVMPRPKAHYRTGKNAAILRDDAPIHHTTTPDLDKLVRCVKDALTGIAWNDDKQVCTLRDTWKGYGENPGVWIRVEVIG